MVMGRQILSVLAPIHGRFRRQKWNLFFEARNPKPTDPLLDVGGNIGITSEYLQLYQFFGSVRVVSLYPRVIEGDQLNHVQCDVADGCRLPLADHSFDWVFSNAVIPES
jgi:hypothetical protein